MDYRTPDFIFAKLRLFVEIKPNVETAQKRMRVYKQFARDRGVRLLIITGEPCCGKYGLTLIFGNGRDLVRQGEFAISLDRNVLAVGTRQHGGFPISFHETTELQKLVFDPPVITSAFDYVKQSIK